MADIMRQRPSVVAIIGELISAGMTQHARVNSKGELRRSAGSLARRAVVPRKNYWKFLEAPPQTSERFVEGSANV